MVKQVTAGRTRGVPSERALGALWQRAPALADGLVGQDGSHFRVAYPGRPNPRAGPDFVDAVITTDRGDVISGDVELHLRAPDWYGHGHDTDPNYNSVVLHVVMWPKGARASRQQSGITTPVVSLAGAESPTGARQATADPMCSLLEAAWGADAETALDRAGDERFFAKSRGFALGLAEDTESPDQALYSALMESAGYASNRGPFLELARRVPIASIYRLQRQPPVTRLMAIRAMLLGAAGLLGGVNPPEHAAELRVLVRHLPLPRPMTRKKWSLFRVRPANHPVARITGMAGLLVRQIGVGLVHGLVGARPVR